MDCVIVDWFFIWIMVFMVLIVFESEVNLVEIIESIDGEIFIVFWLFVFVLLFIVIVWFYII